jgi:hypothetical protein
MTQDQREFMMLDMAFNPNKVMSKEDASELNITYNVIIPAFVHSVVVLQKQPQAVCHVLASKHCSHLTEFVSFILHF